MTLHIEIHGDPSILDRLSSITATHACGVEIVRERAGTYCLHSGEFAKHAETAQIQLTARRLLRQLTAILHRAFGDRVELSLGPVHSPREDGLCDLSLEVATVSMALSALPGGAAIGRPDGTVARVGPDERAAAMIQLASANSHIATVLERLASDWKTWLQLCNILDDIDNDMRDDRSIADRGWIAGRALQRLRRTANSQEAAGLEARHGAMSWDAPRVPMELREAVSLVDLVVDRWFEYRLSARRLPTPSIVDAPSI